MREERTEFPAHVHVEVKDGLPLLYELSCHPNRGLESVRGFNMTTGERFFPEPRQRQFYRLRTLSESAWRRLTGEKLPRSFTKRSKA